VGTILSLKKSTAPCRKACPAGIDVPRYIRHIKDGDFSQALAVIRERIPFPHVCGYACLHPCEAKCARVLFDEAVSIRMLKRRAAESGRIKPAKAAKHPPTGKRVAVIGSGPCGLTAAYFLCNLGYEVTVYEALPLPGGMLRYGIPEYRLPEEIVDREISLIRESGVAIITGTPVSSAEAMRGKGFDAVLAATGAWKPHKMGIPGEESKEVIEGLSFLKKVNEGKAPFIGTKVIVVGGGNTAMDVSRAAVRLGASVTQLYRRTQQEMPAVSEEIMGALEEGVLVKYLTAPVRIGNGQVTCIRMRLGEADASGRRMPVPIPESEYLLPFDTLIVAVGQSADAVAIDLQERNNGTIQVNQGSLTTSKDGIFAAGDAVSGPSTIIDAIAQGREACCAIDLFLGGTGIIPEALPEADVTGNTPQETAPRGSHRAEVKTIALKKRRATFDSVERGFDRITSITEASRCLSCDLRDFDVKINDLICKDCGYCREVCSLGIFEQSPNFNPSGYKPAVPVHTDQCIGCLRCLYICPDFAITIREKKA
jgi:formate dehydrogenase beta subunit